MKKYEEHKTVHKDHVVHHTHDKKKKILIIGIIILAVLIIGAIVATVILTKPKPVVVPVTTDTNTVTSTTDVNMTQEEFQAKATELQLKITKDIIALQNPLFESWYSELGLNKEQMDVCFAANDYTNEDLDPNSATHLKTIMTDYQLAQAIGISGTPGLFINSYKIGGYSSYADLKTTTELAIADSSINYTLNQEGDYNAPKTGKATLIIIYNNSHSETKDLVDTYITNLKSGSYNVFFNALFTESTIIKLDYRDSKAKKILETTQLPILPLFFLEGNIQDTEFYKDSTFSQAFVEKAGGYAMYLPEQQNFNYTYLKQDGDYIVGEPTAKVTMYLFTDYDCPYCEKLDNETMDQFKAEYIDTGKANLIVKDFVVHQETALLPAVFSRCAQEQGKYYEVHRKLFENRSLYGSDAVQGIYMKYDSEIKELQAIYDQLNTQAQ